MLQIEDDAKAYDLYIEYKDGTIETVYQPAGSAIYSNDDPADILQNVLEMDDQLAARIQSGTRHGEIVSYWIAESR